MEESLLLSIGKKTDGYHLFGLVAQYNENRRSKENSNSKI